MARAQAKPPQPLKQDENCLACHGQAGMTPGSGKSISIDPAKHSASVHGILGCTDCHTAIKDCPHPAKVAQVRCSTCHAEASHASNSVHGERILETPDGQITTLTELPDIVLA